MPGSRMPPDLDGRGERGPSDGRRSHVEPQRAAPPQLCGKTKRPHHEGAATHGARVADGFNRDDDPVVPPSRLAG